tara:strand:- start:18 stop:683 length:666 start_codon:yes stop_codon:yes gene_type:complete
MRFINFKNLTINFLKLNLLYPFYFKKVGSLRSIVPSYFFQSRGLIIEKNVVFQNWNIFKSIGNFTFIGKNTYIENCQSIGSYCSISFDVKIGLKNHNLHTISTSPFFYKKSKGWVENDILLNRNPVIIENDVLISSNVLILEGVKIGNGSVVAAGSVVNKDVPPYSIVGGIPAKVIKYRFDEKTINKLISSEWWTYDFEKIKELKKDFDNPNDFLEKLTKF